MTSLNVSSVRRGITRAKKGKAIVSHVIWDSSATKKVFQHVHYAQKVITKTKKPSKAAKNVQLGIMQAMLALNIAASATKVNMQMKLHHRNARPVVMANTSMRWRERPANYVTVQLERVARIVKASRKALV